MLVVETIAKIRRAYFVEDLEVTGRTLVGSPRVDMNNRRAGFVARPQTPRNIIA